MVISVRYLPDWLPIAPFQRRVIELRKVLSDLREKPFSYVLEQMAEGTAENSFASKLIQTEEGVPVDEETKEDIKGMAATFYAAASDTTVSGVQSFFLAMALYPEAQSKAQAEIASYLGSGPRRIILPEDRASLPYTSALLKEVLRWHPIVPVIPHRSSKDDDENVICGTKSYKIPAKSNIMVNVWKILHDPEVYPEPELFVPERFLVENPPPGPEEYIFGFGRRICPGMHVGQQSMWISISNLLSNFTIRKSKDDNGNEIVPKEEYANGVVSHPKPFVCSVEVREGCRDWIQDMTE